MRLLLTLLAFLVFYTSDAADLAGNIRGKVSDKNSGEPLAGVYVIYGKSLGVTTGEDGTYNIQNVSGRVRITFQFIGYQTITKDILVEDNSTVEFDIALETVVREMDAGGSKRKPDRAED